MTKKDKKTNIVDTKPVTEPEPVPGKPNTGQWYASFKIQAVIIALLAIGFYWNTFRHEYALDDTVVILQNEYVHQGIAGIPDILSKDAYFSYYKQLNTSNQLSGGRYRPLSIVTFAVEQQFFGAVHDLAVDSLIRSGVSYERELPYEKRFIQQMHVRHVVNVLLYALTGIVLLWFLRKVVFTGNPVPAFIAALLFVIHPIHTEVVANVKSRDEIMSLLFICLTFVTAFRYCEDTTKKKWLWLSLLCYFLAFLSKEYAITLIGLLPLSFYLFRKETIGKSITATLPYLGVVVLYLLLRMQAIGARNELSDNDIQINPYAWANHAEKIATEIATSLNYLKLLLFPYPLSSDYSYNQIPYKNFGDLIVWVSFAVHLALVYGAYYFYKKRSVMCFAIAFYFLNLLMVNNFIFDIGATMGERLIFHASAGFAIAAAWVICKGGERIGAAQARAGAGIALMLVLIGLCAFKTIDRNKDWKSDATLFLHDVEVAPNSFLVNANVACMLINRSDYEKDTARTNDLHRGVSLYNKVIAMQDNYVLGYMNRSIGYLKLEQPDSMVMDLDKIFKLYPIHPQLPEMYYRAGMLYYQQKQYEKAKAALEVSRKMFPNNQDLQKAINDVNNALQTAK